MQQRSYTVAVPNRQSQCAEAIVEQDSNKQQQYRRSSMRRKRQCEMLMPR